MLNWLERNALRVILLLAVAVMMASSMYWEGVARAATIAAPIAVENCAHVATADSIKVFYCQDINLFVNQLGFMAFEP